MKANTVRGTFLGIGIILVYSGVFAAVWFLAGAITDMFKEAGFFRDMLNGRFNFILLVVTIPATIFAYLSSVIFQKVDIKNEFTRGLAFRVAGAVIFLGTVAFLIVHIFLRRALIPFTPCLISGIIVFFHGKWIRDDALSDLEDSKIGEEELEKVHQ